MATFYLPNTRTLTTDTLRQAPRPEAVPGYASLPPLLQEALVFSWQWWQGHDRFRAPTSGSTGPPRVIEITRRATLASVQLTQQALRLTAQHTALLSMNPKLIGGKMMLARALHIGMDMVWRVPTAHPLRNLPRRPDFIAMVPLQLQTVLEDDPAYLKDAHATLVGGAPVSPLLEEMVRTQVTSPVYHTYGMTETLSHVALRRLNGPEASPYFRVLGNTQMATDERGCLIVWGAVTGGQRVVTNDLVEIIGSPSDDTTPRFVWQGRYDRVINSGGVKVSPERVETVIGQRLTLSEHRKALPRFFVAGIPDPRLGERVVLFVESADLPRYREVYRHLLASVAAELPPYHVPKEIKYIRTFAETPSGKIDRRATVGLA